MEYKFVELMSCQFQVSSEEYIKQQVTYRYNAVKSRLALMQARLADINALVSDLLSKQSVLFYLMLHCICVLLTMHWVYFCYVHANCGHSIAAHLW